jgi:glycerol kinase
MELLPHCVPTRHSFGALLVSERRISLTVATGDQSAALFSLGAPSPDAAYVNMGTGAFIQRAFHQAPEAAGLLTGMVYRDADRTVYVLEGTVNGAGAALHWAEREWGLESIEAYLPEWLVRAGDIPLFLNGVGGLGAPYWAAEFDSRLVGDGEAWQKAVAVVESIVFLLQTNLERMQQLPPASVRLVVSGGLARYDGLCQRLSDLSGLALYRPAEHEATARGTAYLLAGFPMDWPEEKPGTPFAPKQNNGLRQRYQRWRAEMQRALSSRSSEA